MLQPEILDDLELDFDLPPIEQLEENMHQKIQTRLWTLGYTKCSKENPLFQVIKPACSHLTDTPYSGIISAFMDKLQSDEEITVDTIADYLIKIIPFAEAKIAQLANKQAQQH